jgi:dUTP pyrophosphatase
MATEQPETKKRKVSPEPGVEVSSTSNLLIKRLSEKAKLPTRGSALAAGYDLYR